MTDSTLLITTIKIRADARQQFAMWHEKMNKIVTDFPGFVSLEMRPEQKADSIEWTTVQRFRSNPELIAWKESAQRRQLLVEIQNLLCEDTDSVSDQITASTNENQSVTEVFVTQVSPENYDLYSKWAFKIQQIEAQFPGYLGVYIQAPEKEKGGSWITILRFDTPEHLDAWLASKQRNEFLAEADKFVKELQCHRVASPFAGWFANIAKETGTAPSVWKQTMLVLLVLFPIVMLEFKFLSPLTKGVNLSLATFIGNAISVSLVSWPMMPLVIRFLRWWLDPRAQHRRRTLILGTLVVVILYLLEIAIFWKLL